MSTKVQPRTAKAPSTPTEQSITASLTVDIMTDPDTGQPMLVASTQGNQGDLQVVTVGQVLNKVIEQRAQLDRIQALANEYAAYTLAQFVEHYGIELIETPTAKLAEEDPDLAARFRAFSAVKDDGTFIVVVPVGQSAAERLAVIRDLVLDLQIQAGQA